MKTAVSNPSDESFVFVCLSEKRLEQCVEFCLAKARGLNSTPLSKEKKRKEKNGKEEKENQEIGCHDSVRRSMSLVPLIFKNVFLFLILSGGEATHSCSLADADRHPPSLLASLLSCQRCSRYRHTRSHGPSESSLAMLLTYLLFGRLLEQ